VCHHDLFPHNVLVDRDGRVAMLAPREHDVFAALCGPDPVRFLRAYGAERLDLTHLEYARLARSLRDLQFASATRSTWRASTGGASTGCAEWTLTSRSHGHFCDP
jgi:hypothetical protein